MLRLGFPVRIVGRPALRSHDGRRGAAPHLSVGLVYLRNILCYLAQIGVSFYRVAAALIPPMPDAEAHQQLDECAAQLAAIAEQVQAQRVRLTMHLDHTTTLVHPDPALLERSLHAIELRAALLERLGTHDDGVLVLHVGGATGDMAALERFAMTYHSLSPTARARLVVEHDETWSLASLLRLHQWCGIPVVFDYLHWQRYNPHHLAPGLALGLALATWPRGVRPKVHISTSRSEAHLLAARQGRAARVVPPRPGQHADFIAVSDLIALLHAAHGLPPFDIMLEAKAGDVALLRLRSEIAQREPALAALLT